MYHVHQLSVFLFTYSISKYFYIIIAIWFNQFKKKKKKKKNLIQNSEKRKEEMINNTAFVWYTTSCASMLG